LKQIRQEIVGTHQFLAAFLADMYYLSVNPLHEPRLFQLSQRVETQELTDCFATLRQFQEQRRAAYEEELRLLAEQEQRREKEIRELEQSFSVMKERHALIRNRLKSVAVEIDESLMRFEKNYQKQSDIAVKRIMSGESVEVVLTDTDVHMRGDISEALRNFEQVFFDLERKIDKKFLIRTNFELLFPDRLFFPISGRPNVTGLAVFFALGVLYTREKLREELLERKSSLVKKLRKVAEAPILETEAQLQQEEADLIRLLEEKRKVR